jgi:hypothetical protein
MWNLFILSTVKDYSVNLDLNGFRFFGLQKGNLQIERTAFAHHAIHPHAAPMILGNGMDNGESKS